MRAELVRQQKHRADKHVMRRLIAYLMDFKKSLALAFGMLLIATAADVFGPIIMKIFIDDYLTPRHFPWGPLTLLAAGFIGLYAISALFNYFQLLSFQKIALNVIQKMRVDVFSKVQYLGLTFFDQTPGGSLVSRITNDTEAIKELYVSVLSAFISSGIMIIGIFVGMFILDVRLALICLILMPFLTGLTWIYGKLSSKVYRTTRVKLSQLNAKLNESLQGMTMIQAMRQERRLRREFGKINADHKSAMLKSVRLNALMLRSAVYSVYLIGLMMILSFFGIQSFDHVVQIGVLYAFINYLDRFFDPVNTIMQQLNIFQQALVSAERVFGLLDDDRMAPVQIGTESPSIREGKVEFRHVTFSYDGTTDILKNITFTANPGETVALVGHTGSGKSSIINLLMRFYPVIHGDIYIDGKPLPTFSDNELRNRIGLVLQDSFMFVGDVADNIRLSHQVSDDAVKKAAEFVQADQFIEKLPDKYHEVIGERGATFSSGQRQLLSFARTMALNPKILVLDEATASVDTETEEAIQSALEKMRRGRTTIAIAHRLSTIQDADQILVLHQGEIVERGTHQSLLKEKGLYYKMYQLQHGRMAKGTSLMQ
ncbi:ABC transporter ATP-binding protein [Sporolactobacillus sp. THM19-2]|uniref:ABC transporter ATP-binding protein n=1 Tax=Sporolactobacillus sp. THM19-2 TaxID=2511171 RepID=UPI0010216EE2|nr:ABC transporter transmembrane domain-containing protein [Sporolactobacillus sp. THM19-2]RYL93150.1 ATP-binding cassette domain-containing protein [Sporolactobacillus sp. THM19-2]